MRANAAVWNNAPVNPVSGNAHDWYLLACVAGTVLLLLLLVARLRLHAALGLCIAALALGVASGMPLQLVTTSFSTGVGVMMGHIAIILAMGALMGQLLAESGAATALSKVLVEGCGPKGLPWALLCLGILVGMPVFFEVGLVLLLPIIVDCARRSNRPPILVGMPVLAGLSAMHGLVPPHPATMLAATVFHADLGRTILWGLVVGIPAAALAGPVLGWVLLRRWERRQALGLAAPFVMPALGGGFSGGQHEEDGQQSGSAGAIQALIVILLPIALIFAGSWADSLSASGSVANRILHFAGYPDVAMLAAALVALITLGSRIPIKANSAHDRLRRITADSFIPIAGVLVILSAAGGLSGILRDSGAAQSTVGLAMGLHMPPLILAWLLAAIVRVCMGSATVAMAVASGVLAPMASHLGVRPEMLVMATGCGSLVLSHVNDSGFWLVNSLFRQEVKETLSTWSVLETVLSVGGLGITLIVAAVAH